MYDPLRKTFLMLHSTTNWPSFIVWLPLILEKLGNMRIVIIFSPLCDVVIFENKINFFFKPFFYMIKKLKIGTQISEERKEPLP